MPHLNHSLLLLISIFALFTSTFTAEPVPDLVIEVFRHGARGPLEKNYDPQPNYWGNNIGQLTPVGMRMHYLLGNALKQTYPTLLGAYDPAKIYIRSTDVNRTIMSAYSQLYGVFNGTGPGLGLEFNASDAVPAYQSPFIQDEIAKLDDSSALPDKFQVVPVHVVTTPDDQVLMGYSCPMSKNWTVVNGADDEVQSVFQNHMSNVSKFFNDSGLPIKNFWDLLYAGDNCVVNKVHELKLPLDIDPSSQYYKDLKFAMEWYTFKLYESTQEEQALNSVNLLNAISEYINGTVNGTSSLEFVFLSAHDTTLMTLLDSFDITTKDCLLENYVSDKVNGTMPYPNCVYPQFASNLIFELYNTKTEEPYVVFLYNGLPVPFCGKKDNKCTVSEMKAYFANVTDDYSLDDYRKLCGMTVPLPDLNPPDNDDSNDTLKVALLWMIGLCIVLLGGLVYTCVKLRRKDSDTMKYSNRQSLINEF